MFPETITHKVFEANFSFQVNRSTGKVQFLFFKASFFAGANKFSFWPGDWGLSLHSVELRYFPDIS